MFFLGDPRLPGTRALFRGSNREPFTPEGTLLVLGIRQRACTAALAALLTLGSLGVVGVTPAQARSNSKENTWRIGTYIAGAGTIAALAKGKGTLALIGGGATLLSYNQWKKEKNRRHQRANEAAYRSYRTRWLHQHRGRRVRHR